MTPWRAKKPEFSLAQTAVPVVLAPNGTIAANGVVTLVSPLPVTYTSGAWVRFPAGAVVGGAAGLYWVVFTTATVGNVKTNFSDPASQFVPLVPSALGAQAVGSGVAYTQATGADISLANVLVPGGMMGVNGMLKLLVLGAQSNSANAKLHSAKFGGVLLHARNRTNVAVEGYSGVLRNRGTANSQVTSLNNYPSEPNQMGIAPHYTLQVNTAQDQALIICGQLAVGTDFIVLEALNVGVAP